MVAYKASDDDLPDFLSGDGTSPKDDTLARIVGAHLFYPVIPSPKEQEEIDRRVEKNRRKDLQSQEREFRRVYVRGKKLDQMRTWLDALASMNPKPYLTPWEKNFVIDLYVKFKRYKRIRYVTHRQYESLESCAAKYLPMPGVKNAIISPDGVSKKGDNN